MLKRFKRIKILTIFLSFCIFSQINFAETKNDLGIQKVENISAEELEEENKMIEEMRTLLQEKMEEDYKDKETKRDAHPKTLGLLKADFIVLDDIPEELKVGVFKKAKTYKSWIRISNSSGKVQSDKEKDFRGFAIKVLGINERLVNNPSLANKEDKHIETQDFLLLSNPTMPLGTVKLFRDAIYYSIKWHPIVLAGKFLFTGKLKVLKALNTAKNDTSPLDISYWSTTPYMLGDKKVKYKIVPTSKIKSSLPDELTENYLTENMNEHLSKNRASFDFYIQEFKNEEETPIEDAGVKWETPFIKIARIEIPIQNMNTKERFDFAENLFFSPANSLKEHKAIGGLNRARIEIYDNLSKYRHQKNNKLFVKPNLINYEYIK
ncbi:MAG: catalase [Fusobacteriales bacterium]|nr:MAG: catalase [Fusobacteriales bacterium]